MRPAHKRRAGVRTSPRPIYAPTRAQATTYQKLHPCLPFPSEHHPHRLNGVAHECRSIFELPALFIKARKPPKTSVLYLLLFAPQATHLSPLNYIEKSKSRCGITETRPLLVYLPRPRAALLSDASFIGSGAPVAPNLSFSSVQQKTRVLLSLRPVNSHDYRLLISAPANFSKPSQTLFHPEPLK